LEKISAISNNEATNENEKRTLSSSSSPIPSSTRGKGVVNKGINNLK
jgi:hypothetical protein